MACSRDLKAAARAVSTAILTAVEHSSAAVERVCRAVGPLSDDALVAVCSMAFTPSLSLLNCSAALRHLVLPHVQRLSAPASRLLVTGMTALAQQRPEAVVHAVILPALCGTSANLGSAQCELCLRLLRQALPHHVLPGLLMCLSSGLSHES